MYLPFLSHQSSPGRLPFAPGEKPFFSAVEDAAFRMSRDLSGFFIFHFPFFEDFSKPRIFFMVTYGLFP